MKFLDFFKDIKLFTNGYYVIGGQYTREEALKIFQKETGDKTITIDMIGVNRVRFGFPPVDIEDREDFEGKPIWYSGASGTGSQGVWEYSDYDRMVKNENNI